MAYAENTSVPIDRSKAEIERVLSRYGATGFGYMIRGTRAMIMFEAHNRQIRFSLPMPDPSNDSYRKTPTGRIRRGESQAAAYEQEMRRRWRALALAIKAKLEAVDTGITEFEQEFLAHIVLPGNKTVGEMIQPSIEEAYHTGKVVALLPGW